MIKKYITEIAGRDDIIVVPANTGFYVSRNDYLSLAHLINEFLIYNSIRDLQFS